jgi:hypothetical protein
MQSRPSRWIRVLDLLDLLATAKESARREGRRIRDAVAEVWPSAIDRTGGS